MKVKYKHIVKAYEALGEDDPDLIFLENIINDYERGWVNLNADEYERWKEVSKCIDIERE